MMPLYLFTNESFALALSGEPQGAALPPGEWRLLKQVSPAEIDPLIIERIAESGCWLYQPGRPGAPRSTDREADAL